MTHRAVDDLVLAVAVDVGDARAVVALAAVGALSGVRASLSKIQRCVSLPSRQSQAASTARV